MFEKSKRTIAATTRSGTYRIRQDSNFNGSSNLYENGLSRPKNRRMNQQLKNFKITVIFLDDSQHCFEVEKNAKGSVLLERVFQHLELIEKDYFGIQFDELLPPPEIIHPLNSPHLRWLESSKSIKKQIRFTKSTLKNTSLNSNKSIEQPNSVPTATVYFRVKFFIENPSNLHEEYTRYHVFLQIKKDISEGRLSITQSTSALLTSYAIQSEVGDFNEHEHDENGYYLKNTNTLNSLEQTTLQIGSEYISKIVQLHKLHKGQTPGDAEFNYLDHVKRLDGYGITFHHCKDNIGKDIQIGVSSNAISVYYNGIKINTFNWCKIIKIAFKRKCFFIQIRRELSENYDTLLLFDCWSYRSCKRLWKSCVEHHAFFRLSSPPPPNRRPALLLLTLGSRFRYSGRTEYQTREDSRNQSHERERRTFFRSSSKKLLFIRQIMKSQGDSTENEKENYIKSQEVIQNTNSISQNTIRNGNTSFRGCDKVKSTKEKEPKKAWTEEINISDDNDGGFLDRTEIQPTIQPCTITHAARGIAFVDDDESSPSDDGTVMIRLEPDKSGKFGFNIKGGYDMDCPILVSRVAPGTPADQGYPRVNEGDHLLQVNGKDTSTMPHREVVNCIRHAATIRKELVLRVKQNVYTTEEEGSEEPPFQYVPDVPTHQSNEQQTLLSSSMCLLNESIETDSIVNQFELIFRKKFDLSSNASKLQENIMKNRYRDILPYDSTRVILQNSPTGDYINANYVTMEIPVSGIVNRYIACQGPLSTTSIDFWIMIWETQTPLIVMLTTVYERGRIKCHPYWPQHLNSYLIYHNIKVITADEKILSNWIQREFHLIHLETHEERVVIQLQYQSWPDHGVPDDPISFIKFIEQVRKARLGTVEPTIIHCSAGIGRTGVLILMETAECLIEANQPVYPLDIVSQMRIQRPLMIQNTSQYRFVCQCVLKVYQQGIIRPLSEFGRHLLQ